MSFWFRFREFISFRLTGFRELISFGVLEGFRHYGLIELTWVVGFVGYLQTLNPKP